MSHKLIENFIDHLKIDKGSSAHTLSAYTRDLIQFESKNQSLLKVSESDIQKYLKHLKTKEQKTSSIARKVSAIKQFYKFLMRENLISDDPALFIESPKQNKKLPKALDPKTIELLLEAADKGLPYQGPASPEVRPHLNRRDRAMIYLLYATGMRISELIQIKTSNIDTEQGLVKVLGKRNKERLIPFAKIAGELILDYLHHSRPFLKPKSDTLFLGLNGTELTRQAFSKTIKSLASLAGISHNLHAHLLRHTFATDLLKSGMNLRSVQLLLGHQDLQTTQIYTHISSDQLKEVVEKYHPRGKK